jgi:hypothetical protein
MNRNIILSVRKDKADHVNNAQTETASRKEKPLPLILQNS